LSLEIDLSGRVALVTGGSRGLGRADALTLARAGADVVIADILVESDDSGEAERYGPLAQAARAQGLVQTEATAEEIRGMGRRALALKCDVTDAEEVEAAVSRAVDELGSVDILVNNAGGSRRFTLEASEAQWEEALTLNFTRQRQLTHRLLPQMMARKWGRIVNITGKSEPEGLNGAFAAKAAVHSWAKGLSREVGKHGITVNCVPPGRIISEQILRNYPPEFRKKESEEDIPVGEYGQPADIANLVCFLASPLARYITGAVIPVDGGLRRYQF
jgi:3-oxoacyl-[acyl-carrier protein] reductase